MSSEGQQRNIVIVGGGIIGCTTAYFLTRHPAYNPSTHNITIIEATSIASGASGKAGGLLALWAYPASIVPLSYKLHAELAQEHDGAKRWGYRAVNCGSLKAKGRIFGGTNGGAVKSSGEEWQKLPKTNKEKKGKAIAAGVPKDLDWFDAEAVKGYSTMGDPSTTAQVHPYQFTISMADLAKEAGVKIIFGSVTAIDSFGGGVRGVTYEDKGTKHIETMPATDAVLSAGPWTSHVYPEAPIDALRAHSVVIKADVSNYAVFSEIDLPKDFGRTGGGDVKKRRHGLTVSPEMYARPDGTVYACGEADTFIPLPKTSDLVVCDEDRCQDIIDYCGSISTPMREGDVLAKQACYLPSVSGGGGPLIGQTRTKGLYLATGHTCWGIQNSCATGKLMSEFIFDGKAKSAKIDMLDPKKFL
ncbi:FAD dependent oxidoreductase [Acephala macrosclerotiorum]|nr:FAD dependent oxidoreductase [Acephala macrosclerotiorum]